MENFDYCEALESCDAEFQLRKRRIVELEDAIENLQISLEEINEENYQHEKIRKLQDAEEQICQSDLDAAISKMNRVNMDIDQCEIEIVKLSQRHTHTKAKMNEAKTFIQYQLNHSKNIGDMHSDRYLKYPWIANYENTKTKFEAMTQNNSENQVKIDYLKQELVETIRSESSEYLKCFIGSCIEAASIISNIDLTMKKLKENTSSLKRAENWKERILRGMPELMQIRESGIYRKLGAFNSENKTLSRSLASHRNDPYEFCSVPKPSPLRERQLSCSLPTLPLKKLSSNPRIASISGKSAVLCFAESTASGNKGDS